MRECIIGIDAGTASVKGLLVDASGTIIATASAPIRLSTPRPGWAEQSPEDWWKATIQLLDTLTVDRNIEIIAVSISGQMHSLVPRDIEAIRAELRLRAQTEQTPVLDPGGLGLCGRRIRMWRQDCWQLARHDKGCLLEQSGQAFRLQVEADDDQQSRFTVTSRRRDRLDSLVVARPVVLEANGAKECHVLEAVRKGVDACGLGFGGGNGEHEEGSRWIEPDGTLSFHVDDGHGVQGACPSVGSRKRISVHRHQVCGRA